MKTFHVLLCCFVLVISGVVLSTDNVYAEKQVSIKINYPNSTTTIYGTSVVAYGSYNEYNASATPSIYITLDGVTQNTPSLSGGGWGLELDNLSTGWHLLTASIVDQETSNRDSVQFLIIAGHTTLAKNNLILIQESTACEKLLKQNMSSNCPTLGQLKKFDTSNPKLAGKIIQDKNGQWIRTPPIVKGWWNFINKTGKPVVCVECTYDYSYIDLAQLIFIEPSKFEYASLSPYQNLTQTETWTNGTYVFTKHIPDNTPVTTLNVNFDRYVSPDCNEANLFFSPVMMQDTLAYLASGCKKTNLILNKTLDVPSVPFDYAHSSWWKTHLWYGQTRQYTNDCITQKCTVIKDPNSNPGFSIGK